MVEERENMKIILNLIALLLLAYLIYKILERRNNDEKKDLYDEIHARDMKIKQYEKTIKNKKQNITNDTEQIEVLKNEINDLKETLSSTIKESNNKYTTLKIEYEIKNNLLIKEQMKTIELQNKLKDKEHQRRQNASAKGGKQKRIANLEKEIEELKEAHKNELETKENTINFYKSKIDPPSLEEIKAYENGDKEVLKRMKNEK